MPADSLEADILSGCGEYSVMPMLNAAAVEFNRAELWRGLFQALRDVRIAELTGYTGTPKY